jgi:rRNA-processing protein FCF1
MAKRCLVKGGFHTNSDKPVMIGQLQVLELNALEAERSPAKRLLLSLLEAKSVLQINENEELRHTDDILFQMACELQCATLTVDTGLKRRLYEKNLTVLEVRKGTRMHVLESL